MENTTIAIDLGRDFSPLNNLPMKGKILTLEEKVE